MMRYINGRIYCTLLAMDMLVTDTGVSLNHQGFRLVEIQLQTIL